MGGNISINKDAVLEISKAIKRMIEETYSNLNTLSRVVESAELDGWNDSRYVSFKDNYFNAERFFKEGIMYSESVLLPELKRIEALIDNY